MSETISDAIGSVVDRDIVSVRVQKKDVLT